MPFTKLVIISVSGVTIFNFNLILDMRRYSKTQGRYIEEIINEQRDQRILIQSLREEVAALSGLPDQSRRSSLEEEEEIHPVFEETCLPPKTLDEFHSHEKRLENPEIKKKLVRNVKFE